MQKGHAMRQHTARKDIAGGFAVLVIAGLYAWATGDIAESTLTDEVGARGLPRILAFVLAGLGLILSARAIMAGALRTATAPAAAAQAAPENDGGTSSLPRALGLLALGAGYVCLVPLTGYLPAIALLIGAVALYEGAPRNWKTLAIAVAGALAYWAIFVRILGVRQPSGWLF
jgi:putative tricarboxylic transport membrane protein